MKKHNLEKGAGRRFSNKLKLSGLLFLKTQKMRKKKKQTVYLDDYGTSGIGKVNNRIKSVLSEGIFKSTLKKSWDLLISLTFWNKLWKRMTGAKNFERPKSR